MVQNRYLTHYFRRDSKRLLGMLRLFLVNFKVIYRWQIDEVHSLKEDTRGATLEVVVSRMKTVSQTFNKDSHHTIRLIAMSATVPNVTDIAAWLSNDDGTPAIMKYEFLIDFDTPGPLVTSTVPSN